MIPHPTFIESLDEGNICYQPYDWIQLGHLPFHRFHSDDEGSSDECSLNGLL